MKLKALIIAVVMSVMSIDASVYELPIKVVDGVEYYYYTVKAKETLYSLSRQFEMSQEDMLKYNPSLADGLKAGATLYFPVDELNQVTTPIYHIVKKGESVYGISRQYGMEIDVLIAMNPSAKDGIKVGEKLVIREGKKIPAPKQDVATSMTEDVQSVENDPTIFLQSQVKVEEEEKVADVVEEKSYKIALFMPFMLNEEVMSNATRTYLDFYKGFLLAAKELSNSGQLVDIYAYDTYGNIDSLSMVLSQPEMSEMNVIIAPPGENKSVELIASSVDNPNVAVFNAYYANDTTHLEYRNVIQANIVRDKMYNKAIARIVEEYGDYVPVIIGSQANTNKAAIAEMFKAEFEKNGVESQRIIFKRSLQPIDLTSLNKNTKYLFIPLSSSERELEKCADALIDFRKGSKANVAMLGYPEWVVFNNAMLSKLHSLNTVIYSRFYFNENGDKEKEIANKFEEFYKTPMKKSPPIQAVLGYDCGYYVIKALRGGNGDLFDGRFRYEGMQNVFDFTKSTTTIGAENQSLYMIYYRPKGNVDCVIF